MIGAEIATAFVRIRPNFGGFKSETVAGVKGTLTEVQAIVAATARANVAETVKEVTANRQLALSYQEIGAAAEKGSTEAAVAANLAAQATQLANAKVKAATLDLNGYADAFTHRARVAGTAVAGLASAAVMATGGAALGVGVLGGIVGYVGIKFDDLKQRSTIAFTTMLGSGRRAQAFLNELQAFAARTPFQFPDLITTSQQLLAMGFRARQIVPTMTAIGNAVAGLGGSREVLGRVVLAIGQIQAKGKASAEEFRQLAEAGIPAWQFLATKLGTSTGEAMKLVQNSAVDAQTAIAALTEGMQAKFGGMMEKQSHTFSGLLSTISDNFKYIAGQVMEPFFEMATRGMQRLVDEVSKPGFTDRVDAFAASLDGKVRPALVAVGEWFAEHWGEIKAGFADAGALAQDFARYLVGALKAANAVAGAVGGWKNAIELAAAAWITYKAAMAAAMIATRIQVAITAGTIKVALISSGIGAVAVAAGLAAAYVITHWDKVKGWFTTFYAYLRATNEAGWQAVKETGKAAANAVIRYFTWVVRQMLSLASHIPFVGGKAKHALNEINALIERTHPDWGKVGATYSRAFARVAYASGISFIRNLQPYIDKMMGLATQAATAGMSAAEDARTKGLSQPGMGGKSYDEAITGVGETVNSFINGVMAASKASTDALAALQEKVGAAKQNLVDTIRATHDAVINAEDAVKQAQQHLADVIREGHKAVNDAVVSAKQNLNTLGGQLAAAIGRFLDAMKPKVGSGAGGKLLTEEFKRIKEQIAAGITGPDIGRQARELASRLQARATLGTTDVSKEKERVTRQLADITDLYNKHAITREQLEKRITAILKREHITRANLVKKLGVAGADEFMALLTGVKMQAKALGAGPRGPGGPAGSGLLPSIVRPLEALKDAQRNQAEAAHALARQQRDLQRAQLNEQRRTTAASHKVAKAVAALTKQEAKVGTMIGNQAKAAAALAAAGAGG